MSDLKLANSQIEFAWQSKLDDATKKLTEEKKLAEMECDEKIDKLQKQQ